MIGAGGLNAPVTYDNSSVEDFPGRPNAVPVGEPVASEDVAAVDAVREPVNASDPLVDLDHVDDDDDDDIEDEEAADGSDDVLEFPNL